MRRVVGVVSNNWQLKLTAFVIACLLWYVVQSGKPYLYRMPAVPIQVAENSSEWTVSSAPSPATVSVEFRAPFRDLLRLSAAHPVIVIPVDSVRDTAAVYALRASWVELGEQSKGIEVGRIKPDTARVAFDHIATRLVTLRALVTGSPASGFEAGLPLIDPAVVRATGPARRLSAMDTIDLPAIDVTGAHGNTTMEFRIDTAGMGALITPVRGHIVVPVRAKAGGGAKS